MAQGDDITSGDTARDGHYRITGLPDWSQSISSDHISESSILRAAGNIVGHDVEDWLVNRDRRLGAVKAAVETARLLADEVQRTAAPVVHVPPHVPDIAAHVLELDPSEAYKLGWYDAWDDRRAGMDQRGCEADGGLPRTTGEPADDGGEGAALLRLDVAEPKGSRPLTEHEQSGAVDVSCERLARDLLLRLGVAGSWTSGDLAELANLYNVLGRHQRDAVELRAARADDQHRLHHYEGAIDALQQGNKALLEQVEDLRRRLQVPVESLTVDVEVCSGCGRQTHVRGDCGCPAGTATRRVPAISEEEYRQKAKTVRQALLGPGVRDPGHPPTAEMARTLRADHTRSQGELDRAKAVLEEERTLRRAADEDYRAEINRLAGLLRKRGDQDLDDVKRLKAEVDRLQVARIGDSETIGRYMSELKSARDDATTREARVLRGVAEELENGLRSGAVTLRALVDNEIRWCRAQARNLRPSGEGQEPGHGTFVAEVGDAPVYSTLHGGERGGKSQRLHLEKVQCPSCGSDFPGSRHLMKGAEPGQWHACSDAWHDRCPECGHGGSYPSVPGGTLLCLNPWHSKVQP